ncbi:MAG: alpha/beta fold hydrolase [Gemmatimonadaceae bacterium]
MSGRVALALVAIACHASGRVSALVLASPGLSGFVSRDPMPFMAPVMAAARAGDTMEAARAWAASSIMFVGDTGQAARLRAIVMDNAALWGITSNPEVALQPPAVGRLAEVRVPTLVLLGANDLPATRQAAPMIAAGIGGSRLVEIPATVHMLNFAAPERFRREVDAFLRR